MRRHLPASPTHRFSDSRWLLDQVDVPACLIDQAGRLSYANDEWLRLLGAGSEEPWGWLTSVSEEDATYVRRALARALEADRSVAFEFAVSGSGGPPHVFACKASAVHIDEAQAPHLFVLCWDVTERQRNEERLAFMAGHDPLTGLANRRVFEEALARAVARAQRGTTSAVLLLDLDNLKRFNDHRGHLEGDQALVNLGLLLRAHVRAGDLPARVGGDEFAVLCEDIGLAEAREIAERIRETVAAEEFVSGAREHGLGVSAGISPIEGDIDPRAALDRADSALYEAKALGRNRVVVWDKDVGGAAGPAKAASRVQEAFENDSFLLAYQPVVRLADLSPSHFEGRIRMADSRGVLLGPSEFLPVVERLGLAADLTRVVVRKALWDLATAPSAVVSVSLSLSNLGDAELLEDVASLLCAAGSANGRLVFSAGESAVLSNMRGASDWLQRLRDCGSRFILDEFGTGRGIFTLLREHHISQVKLSHAAMGVLDGSPRSQALLDSVRRLIESQGKDAVATFIESERMLEQALAAGFVYGQGYHICRPEEDLVALVERFGAGE